MKLRIRARGLEEEGLRVRAAPECSRSAQPLARGHVANIGGRLAVELAGARWAGGGARCGRRAVSGLGRGGASVSWGCPPRCDRGWRRWLSLAWLGDDRGGRVSDYFPGGMRRSGRDAARPGVHTSVGGVWPPLAGGGKWRFSDIGVSERAKETSEAGGPCGGVAKSEEGDSGVRGRQGGRLLC